MMRAQAAAGINQQQFGKAKRKRGGNERAHEKTILNFSDGTRLFSWSLLRQRNREKNQDVSCDALHSLRFFFLILSLPLLVSPSVLPISSTHYRIYQGKDFYPGASSSFLYNVRGKKRRRKKKKNRRLCLRVCLSRSCSLLSLSFFSSFSLCRALSKGRFSFFFPLSSPSLCFLMTLTKRSEGLELRLAHGDWRPGSAQSSHWL